MENELTNKAIPMKAEDKGCHNCNFHCMNHNSCDCRGICKQGEKWQAIPDPLAVFAQPEQPTEQDFLKEQQEEFDRCNPIEPKPDTSPYLLNNGNTTTVFDNEADTSQVDRNVAKTETDTGHLIDMPDLPNVSQVEGMTAEEILAKIIPNYSRVKFGNAGTYVVADIKEQFGTVMIGIYDEPPSGHIDYLNLDHLELVDEYASQQRVDIRKELIKFKEDDLISMFGKHKNHLETATIVVDEYLKIK